MLMYSFSWVMSSFDSTIIILYPKSAAYVVAPLKRGGKNMRLVSVMIAADRVAYCTLHSPGDGIHLVVQILDRFHDAFDDFI